jgi:hypothetical protein
VPSDSVYRARTEGDDDIVGPVTGHNEHCTQVVSGVDAEGAPAIMGMTCSDPIGVMIWPDGSSLSGTWIDMEPGFDAETGEMTIHSVTMFTEGTGKHRHDRVRYVSGRALGGGGSRGPPARTVAGSARRGRPSSR